MSGEYLAYFKVERVAWAAANVFMTTVSWLVVIVTLARYCAICRPLDTLQIGRSKRVRKVCRPTAYIRRKISCNVRRIHSFIGILRLSGALRHPEFSPNFTGLKPFSTVLFQAVAGRPGRRFHSGGGLWSDNCVMIFRG